MDTVFRLEKCGFRTKALPTRIGTVYRLAITTRYCHTSIRDATSDDLHGYRNAAKGSETKLKCSIQFASPRGGYRIDCEERTEPVVGCG